MNLNQIRQLGANWLLVKPHQITKIGNIYIPDTSDKSMLSFTGEIVRCCDNLYYEEQSHNTMPWDVDLELKVGDTIHYNPFCNVDALPLSIDNPYGRGHGMYDDNGEFYMFMHYRDVFFAQRGNDIICVNAFVLGEYIDDVKESLIILLDKSNMSYRNRCKVVSVGAPAREYSFGLSDENFAPDDKSIEVGDELLLMPYMALPVDKHSKLLDRDKDFCRFRRRDVLAKITETELVPVSRWVVIEEPNGETTLPSGIILLDRNEAEKKDARRGKIISIGGMTRYSSVGDNVYYNHSDGIDVKYNDKHYKFVLETKILINNGTKAWN